uniref:Uncharacterized protein n=1 Tax=Pithovirus LCDPAC01 TaxID=2506600 RepID=A0A481YN55_9VIRU|nr:MAG: hypothetical protein LCDPAC01_01990 [Pithovirus LCDPAC01]
MLKMLSMKPIRGYFLDRDFFGNHRPGRKWINLLTYIVFIVIMVVIVLYGRSIIMDRENENIQKEEARLFDHTKHVF